MIPDSYPPQSTGKGIALKIASVVTFTTMAAMLKSVSDEVPPGEMVFFRSSIGIVPILIWLAVTHQLADGLRVRQPLSHVLRGVIGTGSMGAGFAALGYLPLPEATAISYAAPLLTVIFAALLLGEKVRLIRSAAVALGLVGVLIVLLPQLGSGSSGQSIGVAIALCAAGCTALVQIQIRRMVVAERTSAIVFWFSITASVLSLATLPFGWVVPTPEQAAMLIGAGLLGGTAQILMTSAYRLADVSVVAPFEYVSMIVALVLGYVFFSEVPVYTTLIGAAVVIAAGVLIIWREHQLGLERRRQRKAATPQG